MIFLDPYKKYFQLSGRATRKEYCLFILFLIVLALILTWVDIATGSFNEKAELGLLSGIWACISAIPYFTVMVRRLHDTDRSGWWFFVSFIPLIGFIWMVVVVFCMDGTRGPNRFGPDPKSIVD